MEMQPLKPQQKNCTTVYVPNSTSSNQLIRRNVIAVLGTGATIGAAAYLAYNMLMRIENHVLTNNTEPLVNQSSLSLFNIYKHVKTNYSQCEPAFARHWELFKNCGAFLCDCVRNAREAFENHCPSYAQNIAQNPLMCKELANTMQGCKEHIC